MNSFSSDQMLLPSITHLLDSDVNKGGHTFAASLTQSLLADDELTPPLDNVSLRADTITMESAYAAAAAAPKLLTPPNSPVFSELTTPTYLLKMTSHDGSQLVPNMECVEGLSLLGNGLHLGLLQSLDGMDTCEDLEHLYPRDIMNSTSTKSDMFDDTDSGSDWPGIYIDDNDDTNVPSPSQSPHFDAPCYYNTADIDSIILFPESARTERRKYNSVSTEESSQSDSGSELGSCPSPTIPATIIKPFHSHHTSSKSKTGRTHNYQRRTITKSLNELQEGGVVVGKAPGGAGGPAELTERRKRGRPRKRLTGDLGEKESASRRKGSRKAVKGSHLWEFILEILKSEQHCPQVIRWEDKARGIFRIVNSKAVASMWGKIKNNPRMTYEKLSRAMRYYYKRDILERVDKMRLVYKFGQKAEGWRKGVADE